MKDYHFKDDEEFENLTKYMTFLHSGSEGSCYFYNNKVIKYFDMVPHEDYTVEKLLKNKDIKTNNYYFPQAILYNNNKPRGYLMEYAKGEKLSDLDLSRVNKKELLRACKDLLESTKTISNKGITISDPCSTNMLFDNTKFSVIDTAEYGCSDEDDKVIYNNNAKMINGVIIKRILKKGDLSIIKKFPELYQLCKDKYNIVDIEYVLMLLYKNISDYCGMDIENINDGRKIYKKLNNK